MPIQTMQSVAEHTLFKAALPLVCAALVGSISWIFVAVMDLDKLVHKIEDSEIPQINQDLAQGYKKIDELQKELTDLRIRVAEIASPGHPARQRNWSNREE